MIVTMFYLYTKISSYVRPGTSMYMIYLSVAMISVAGRKLSGRAYLIMFREFTMISPLESMET
jgi:hypothetical protein